MIAFHCIWLFFALYCKCWVLQLFRASNYCFNNSTLFCDYNLLLAPIGIYVWLSKISKCWLTTWCWLWCKGMAVDSMPALNICRKSFLHERNMSDNVLGCNCSPCKNLVILACVSGQGVVHLVFVLACKYFLQFKVQRKIGAALFPLLRSVALICFQTHGRYYTRSWKMT